MSVNDEVQDDRPQDDETLVAYLDGQLGPEECEAIEARLATDEGARERLQTFDRVWNALDALPRSTASASFTRSTIDMAAVTAAEAATPRRRLVGRPPAWLLTATVGVLVGGLLAIAIAGAPERRAISDLPVALNESALEQVASIEFLRTLADQGQDVLRPFQSDRVATDAENWGRLTENDSGERRRWVGSLSPGELAGVNERIAAFDAKSESQRQKLRTLAAQIAEDDDATDLRTAALAYDAMVSRLPAGDQSSLRQSDDDERMKLVLRRGRWLARDAALELSDAERDAFRKTLETTAAEDAFAEILASRGSGFPRELTERVRERPLLAPLFVTGMIARADRSPMLRSERGRVFFDRMTAAWGEWLDQIEVGLPDRVRNELAEQRDAEGAARLLTRILRELAPTNDLSEVFVKLPNEEMQSLLLLPRDEFTERLSEQVVGGFPDGPPRGFDNFRDRGGRGPRGRERRDGPPPEQDRPRRPPPGPR